MAESSNKISQIHVRVPPEFKRALKIFCVREGTTLEVTGKEKGDTSQISDA